MAVGSLGGDSFNTLLHSSAQPPQAVTQEHFYFMCCCNTTYMMHTLSPIRAFLWLKIAQLKIFSPLFVHLQWHSSPHKHFLRPAICYNLLFVQKRVFASSNFNASQMVWHSRKNNQNGSAFTCYAICIFGQIKILYFIFGVNL